jgi:hypothetical protein
MPSLFNETEFFTRGFLIRYCEEEVELNDIAYYRFELDFDENFENSSLWVCAELLFTDLGGNFEDLSPEHIE